MAERPKISLKEIQPAADQNTMFAQERRILETGETQSRMVERPFHDGKTHTVQITKFPVYNEAGRVTRVGSVSVDITEQHEAQLRLQESEARFRSFA